MKKLLLLITICTLINGCGLFKSKIKTSEKYETTALNEVKAEKRVSVSEHKKESSIAKLQENSNQRQQLDIDSETTVKADKITGSREGFTAVGNAELINRTRDKSQGEKNTGKTVEASKGIDTKTQTDSQEKEQVRQKEVKKDSEVTVKETPSVRAWVGFAVFLVIVVSFLLWWFGIRPNKAP